MSLVPHSLLFQTRQKLFRLSKPPAKRGKVPTLPEEFRIENPSRIDGGPEFADVRIGWHSEGWQVSVVVSGKKRRPVCNPEQFETADGLKLWIDTRNTPGVHRANRFCQLIAASPSGGGAKKTSPLVRKLPIPRCREASPDVGPDVFRVGASVTKTGYTLNLWIPAEALHGYDPDHSPVCGFFYAVSDSELGEQTLSASHELPFTSDPSLWQSVELAPPAAGVKGG